MPPRFRDHLTGRTEAFAPAQPPLVDFRWDPGPEGLSRRREEAVVGALLDALVFFGYSINQNVTGDERADLCAAAARPERAAVWLKLGPVEGQADGAGAEWRLLCLSARHDQPLRLDAGGLAAARAELERWRSAAAAGGRSLQPNAKGLAVYRQRFRDALAADFDTPAALEVVRDALRPGALSPGSLSAFLQESDEALGLGLGLGLDVP